MLANQNNNTFIREIDEGVVEIPAHPSHDEMNLAIGRTHNIMAICDSPTQWDPIAKPVRGDSSHVLNSALVEYQASMKLAPELSVWDVLRLRQSVGIAEPEEVEMKKGLRRNHTYKAARRWLTSRRSAQ